MIRESLVYLFILSNSICVIILAYKISLTNTRIEALKNHTLKQIVEFGGECKKTKTEVSVLYKLLIDVIKGDKQ